MTKESSFRISIADIMVPFFCAAGFTLCIFLFWRDLNATFYRLGEQPIGTITFRYNTAQRRFADRVAWDRLRNDSPVYNGDFIRTADVSEATVTFSNGGIAEIYSNTLIQIFMDKIEFTGGGISINTSSSASGMVIASGNNTLSMDAGVIMRAAALEDGALDLTVSEGSVVLESLDFQNVLTSHSLTAGEAVLMNAQGEAQNSPRAASIFPPPGARYLSQSAEGLSLEFAWNKINYSNEELTHLEISADRNFSRKFYSGNTENSRLLLTLPEGTWFWRLYPASAADEQSLTNIPYSRITITGSPVPALISPTEGQSFSFRSRHPSLRFQWTSSAEASNYLLEAADNPSITNPALTLNVRSGNAANLSVVSSVLGEGIWYWRVTPVYGSSFNGTPVSSAIGSFVIDRDTFFAAPVLTAPVNEAFINIDTGRRDIMFSWRNEPEAAHYILRISSNSDMSSPVIERTLTDSFFRYRSNETILTPGVWYWTVQQAGSYGDISPAAAVRTFTAIHGEIIQRTVFPPDNYTIADNLLPDIRFTWVTNLDNTFFQVSDTREFTTLLLNEPAASQVYSISSLRSGTYFWRIISVSGTQQRISQVRRFIISGAMPPPELRKPSSPIENLIVIQQGQPVNFTWIPTPNADFYSFKLFHEDDLLTPVFETLAGGTSLPLNMANYRDGSYTWTVQGLARESATSSRRTGLASSQTADFKHQRPVVLEYPYSGFEYSGMDASRNPGTVRWSSQEEPFEIQFILASDARMSNIITIRNDVPFTFQLPRLNAGDYFWTIQAQSAEGINISSRAPSRFRVLPIPPLPAPSNRLPADNYLIGAAQIRASRNVDFSWNPVQEANSYKLTIFHGSGRTRTTVIQTPPLTETSYTVEDVRLLGRGNFSWQVEAVMVLNDGFIERHGQLQENRFTIDIPSPAQIQTRDSGILYGK